MSRSTQIAHRRQDLNNVGIPYGENGKFTNPRAKRQRWAYQWINEGTDEELFQIKVNGKWENAESIDFDLK